MLGIGIPESNCWVGQFTSAAAVAFGLATVMIQPSISLLFGLASDPLRVELDEQAVQDAEILRVTLFLG